MGKNQYNGKHRTQNTEPVRTYLFSDKSIYLSLLFQSYSLRPSIKFLFSFLREKKGDFNRKTSNSIPFYLKFISIILGLIISNSANSLTITTSAEIRGNAPYLTFDNGVTSINTMDPLLNITLSDGRSFSLKDSLSTKNNPIQLPAGGEKLKNIKTELPSNKMKISLLDLISSKGYWGDDDGDNLYTVSGNLTLTVKKANGEIVNDPEEFLNDACNSPYQLSLTSDSGVLSTRYGFPNSSNFIGHQALYYLIPNKLTTPYFCFARPNLQYNDSAPFRDFISLSGPQSQWDDTKGFKLQNLYEPSTNFPTTASKGLYFYLTVAGVLSSEVSYSKSPKNSGISLNITTDNIKEINVAKVEFQGPGNGSSAAEAATATTPTTFTIYSDKDKKNVIYRFTISKWFIAKPGYSDYASAKSYCENLGYQIPSIIELTNANGWEWQGGLPNQPNNYQRRIGPILFAEWGFTDKNYYTNSDLEYGDYWAAQIYTDLNEPYLVHSDTGDVYHGYVRNIQRAACVH